MRKEDRAVWLYIGLVAFSLAGFAFSRWTRLQADWVARPSAILTLGTGCWAAFQPLVKADRGRALAALAAIWSIGFSAEVVGLATGFPFGRYRYTDQWWPVISIPHVGLFPLQLPFAWMLVSGCTYLGAANYLRTGAIVIAALAATLIDQAMEPAMTHTLEYWKWRDVGPLAAGSPWSNAAGWFVVSLLASWAMSRLLGKAATVRSPVFVVIFTYILLVLGLDVIGRAIRL